MITPYLSAIAFSAAFFGLCMAHWNDNIYMKMLVVLNFVIMRVAGKLMIDKYYRDVHHV